MMDRQEGGEREGGDCTRVDERERRRSEECE
jgi:hypothetical protein